MITSPLPTSADAQDAFLSLRRALSQAAEVAAQMERGQAFMPLCDHLAALESDLKRAPFVMLVLGLDKDRRAAVLSWLCGPAGEMLSSIDQPSTCELLEVQLISQGYALYQEGRRWPFDRLPDLLEAVRTVGQKGSGNGPILQVELAADRVLQGIKLVVPQSAQALTRAPALLSRLLAQANFLVVAGVPDQELDPALAAALQELEAGMDATWVILYGEESDPPLRSCDRPSVLGSGTLPLVQLGRNKPFPPLPAMLTQHPPGIRATLFGCQQARRLESAVTLLEDHLRHDLRQQETRRNTLQRRSLCLADRQRELPAGNPSVSLRRDLEERLVQLETDLADRFRARVLPTSPPMNKINNLLEDFSADDLAEEAAGHTVQLGVPAEYLRQAARQMEEMLHADVRTDIQEVQHHFQALTQAADTRLAEATGASQELLCLPALDEPATWQALHKMIHLDFHYQGEAQRRGLLDLISHGRRPVVITTMVLSMFGAAFGAGSRFRLLLAPLMLLLFLVSLAWAWYEFRRERQDRREHELRRLRETLGTDLKRLYELVLREWHERLTRHLRQTHKELTQRTEDRLRAWALEQSRTSDQERQEVLEKTKIIEQRLRELAGLGQQVLRLRQAATEARQTLTRATQDALQHCQTLGTI